MNDILDDQMVDSVELKCLVVSRGLKVDREVYQRCGGSFRVDPNALTGNCFKLPDGTMKGADLDDFRRVKEMLGELYVKYHLEPAGCCGLNVCIERDIWRWMTGAPCC